MSLILLPPWRTQPQFPAPIDRGAPINRGLAFLAPMGPGHALRDLATGRQGTQTGTGSRGFGRAGSYPVFSSGNYVDFSNPHGISGTTPITIAWTQEPRSHASYSCLLAWKPTGATNQFLIYQSSTDSNYAMVIGPRAGSAAQFSAAVGLVTDFRVDHFALTLAGGTESNAPGDYILWRNGARITTASTQAFSGGTSDVFRIGAMSDASDPWEGLIGNFHIWNRVLTDNEAQAWTLNPFMTRQPTRRLWALSSAAGGTVTATASLSAAVQIAKAASAGIAAAVQAGRSSTAGITAAMQASKAATAGLAAAAEAQRISTAALSAAVQDDRSAGAGMTSAIRVARAATAALSTAVGIEASVSAGTSAAVLQARPATGSLAAYLQAGNAAAAAMAAAVLDEATAAAGLSSALKEGRAGAASASAALQLARSASAALSVYLQADAGVSASISAAIQQARTAAATVAAAVQTVEQAAASLSAAVARNLTSSAAVSAAVLGRRSAGAGMGAYIIGLVSAELSAFWRYDVPADGLRYDVPEADLRFDVPSIGAGLSLS